MADDIIPYDELRLREAYREGWRTWARGELIPAEFFDENVEEAFRRGYNDAETQEASTNRKCHADVSGVDWQECPRLTADAARREVCD